jgi:chromosome segregation ATPase
MATSWNPAAIFDIRPYEKSSDIQCVGRALSSGGKRCRWNISGHGVAQAYQILRNLASIAPDEVRSSDLTTLAGLCLCRDFHSRQVSDVVRRWENLVASVARDFADSSTIVADSSSIVADSNTIIAESKKAMAEHQAFVTTLTQERRRCLVVLGLPENSTAELDKTFRQQLTDLGLKGANIAADLLQTRTALESSSRDHAAKHSSLEEKLRLSREAEKELEKLVQSLRSGLSLAETRLDEEKNMHAQTTELLQAAKTKTTVYNDEQQQQDSAFRSLVTQQLADVKDRMSEMAALLSASQKSESQAIVARGESESRLAADLAVAKRDAEQLATELATARADKERLKGQVIVSAESLRQSEAQVEEAREARANLGREVLQLTVRISHLEKDRLSCRLHSLGTRLGNSKSSARSAAKSSSPPQLPLSVMSEKEVITSQIRPSTSWKFWGARKK